MIFPSFTFLTCAKVFRVKSKLEIRILIVMPKRLTSKKMLRRFSYIILILTIISCAQSSEVKSSRVEYLKMPVERFTSIKEAFETYRSGTMNIMNDVPEYTKYSDSAHILSQYKSSIYKNLSWSYIKRDNTIIALTPGMVPGYCISFIDLDHPALETRKSTLNTRKINNLVVTVIRPYKISEKWAGIFLVHEFAHAKEYMEHEYLNSEESECSAYKLEKIAVNHITNNRFDEVLNHIIEIYKIIDVNQLVAMHKKDRVHIFIEIDKMLGEEAGRSIAEVEMRYGFYLVSLSLRLSERNDDQPEITARKVKMILDKFSLF